MGVDWKFGRVSRKSNVASSWFLADLRTNGRCEWVFYTTCTRLTPQLVTRSWTIMISIILYSSRRRSFHLWIPYVDNFKYQNIYP
jgi:hypothetical protein